MDLKSYSRWYDYSRARDAMFAATDTARAPWYIAHTDDKKRGRSTSSATCSARSPTSSSPPGDVTLPKRQRPGGYVEPDLPLRHIPPRSRQPGKAAVQLLGQAARGCQIYQQTAGNHSQLSNGSQAQMT